MRVQRFLGSLALMSLLASTACSEQATEVTAGKSLSPLKEQTKTPQNESSSGAKIALDVYKSPTCSCCAGWIDHAEQRGFSLTSHHPVDLNSVKAELGIAPQYQSCHTAVSTAGYLFEGHVPARYVQAFLAAPPENALGLSVPKMPVGSPGMEMGQRFTPYTVLLLKKDGSAELFAEVTTAEQQYR